MVHGRSAVLLAILFTILLVRFTFFISFSVIFFVAVFFPFGMCENESSECVARDCVLCACDAYVLSTGELQKNEVKFCP